jgi:diguanylate cyclase (GGDEF)-like protein/PAS domain S-box-containing protein
MPKQPISFLRVLRWATIAVFIVASLEFVRQAVFSSAFLWPTRAAGILVGASIVSVLNLSALYKSKVYPDKFPAQLIIESLPEIACIIGEDGRIKKWNSNLETALGYRAEEIEKVTTFDTIPEEERETVKRTLAKALTDGAAKTESILFSKDGTRIPCLLTGVRIIMDGAPCVLGIAVDLRKFKQAEEFQLRLASIVEFSEDAIIGKDIDGVITSWNRAAEKMYGYTTVEAVGRNVTFLVPSERQAETCAILDRVRNGLSTECLETRRITKTGSVLDVSVSISPIRDAAGRVTGASTIARDISLHKRAEQQLDLQSAALEAAANAIVITDYEGTILWVNRAFTGLTGYSEMEVLGKNHRVLKSGKQPLSYYADMWSVISSGNVWKGELINRRKDGTLYVEDMTITPVTRDAGNPANRYFIAIKQDITERKRAEESLLFKTALLEAQAETTLDGILVVDDVSQIILVNKQFGLHFGIPDELLLTRDDQIVLAHVVSKIENPDAFLERVRYLYSHRDEKSRDEFRLKNGRIFDRYSAPLFDSQKQYRGRIWYFRDITNRKTAEERVQYLAYYDALTGLANRALLKDRLSKAIARARRHGDKVVLLFLDLDQFKNINDSLGHSVGDLFLKGVAERLKKWGREQDTVARIGGDEFLLMLTDVKDIPNAAAAAERLMGTMRSGFVVQDRSISIGCSMGISIFPDHGADPETLIMHADSAMYYAKDSGRNNFRFFTEDMNTQAMERLTLESGLRLALDKNQLFLMYQPQMEIATGRIIGLEALLRWQHPELGLVPPDKFIRIAENSGMILPIGEWALTTACRQAKKWQDEGLPAVSMAVNISAVQVRQKGFCDLIRRILRETGLAPHYLELELTESLLLANADLVLSVVQELETMGLTLAIDDFGTGYSSFSYLKQFRASKLKIDRSFITEVAVKADDAAITAAIISMAKSLNLKVIAEGVEDEAQMSFLRSHHCDEIQGYYFSKPLRVGHVAEMLQGTAGRALSAKHGR